jgi:ketosteroid isomerase-like protein/quercetin dioxygenase-like cupin family protein
MRRSTYITGLFAVTFVFLISFIAPSQSLAQDPTKIAPQSYKLVIDNDRVRVIDYRLNTGGKEPMHSHPSGVVVYYFTDAKMRTTLPDGKTAEGANRAGDIIWRDPVTHFGENVGGNEIHALLVEPKTQNCSATEAERTPADISTEIKTLETELARAVVGRDYAALKRIEADNYVYTDSDARVNTRDEFIEAYHSGKSTIPMLRFHDMVVDVYGSVAVVRGMLTVERTDNGVPLSRTARYTRTYVRFPEGWRAVAGHSSQLKK